MNNKNKIVDFQQTLNRLEGFIDELPHHEYTKQFLLYTKQFCDTHSRDKDGNLVFITGQNDHLFNSADENDVFTAIETIRTALKKLQPKE